MYPVLRQFVHSTSPGIDGETNETGENNVAPLPCAGHRHHARLERIITRLLNLHDMGISQSERRNNGSFSARNFINRHSGSTWVTRDGQILMEPINDRSTASYKQHHETKENRCTSSHNELLLIGKKISRLEPEVPLILWTPLRHNANKEVSDECTATEVHIRI